MWECSVTRTSVELNDMGERNGGRPAGEGTKTPCSTLVKFKSVLSRPRRSYTTGADDRT